MAETSFNPYEILDFSGGITDNIFEQDPRFAASVDNFVLDSNNRLISRDGSLIDVDDPADDQIPAGVERIGTLINYDNDNTLFVHSLQEFYWRDPISYATLTGPTGNSVLSLGDETNALSYSQWNKHIFVTSDAFPRPMKIYQDENDDYQVRTSGLPRLATSPTVTAGAAGGNTYIYAFHYEYTYIVADQTFQDVGSITFFQLENSGDPGTNPNSITGIPVISNGVTDNWDTAVIKVFIFRTINGGDVFYKIGEVTNGTTVFSDTFADDDITENELMYTTDGTVEFDPVPEAKFVHVVNNTGYYGFIKSGSEIFPFAGRQSIPGDPDSVPETFEFILEDEVQGISSAKSVPIYLCKRYIYRIDGFFDQFGKGFALPVRISDTAGCVSHLSIVQAENGIFWAGNDGFYYSDGYQVLKVSDHINTRYKNILAEQSQTNRILGKFDEQERRVLWCLQRDSGNLDNDSLAVLDVRKPPSDQMPFVTWSGNSFRPTAVEFFAKSLYRADTRGYVFIHDPDVLTDPKVDTTEAAEDWHRETLIWTYESINYNFGSTFFRKQPSRVLLTAANRANTTIQISAVNDDGKSIRDMKPIRWRKNFTWGDEEFVWGNQDCVWKSTGIIEQWRRFPSRGLRLSYLQLVITNGFSPITNSDTIGLATFDTTLKTVTLDEVGASWSNDSVDYFIAVETDGYVEEYLILERNSDTVITVNDTNNTLPDGSFKWVVRGFKKDEPLDLLSYNIFWNEVSQTQEAFTAAQSGENA